MTARRDDKMMRLLRQAFLDYGYQQPTMIALAQACDLTRRALYHHFSNKEEAFREVIRWRHGVEIEVGLAAGRRRVGEGASTLDAIVAVFDARYGEARRDLERSPHALELDHEAFRRCRDVMSESAAHFQACLTDFLGENGRLRLRPGVTFAEAAQWLADGVRGVNLTLPARPSSSLSERYRRMCEAVLYGCAETPRS